VRINLSSTIRSERDEIVNQDLPENSFVPRIGDTIVIGRYYWDVESIVVDYEQDDIRIYLMDSKQFSS